MISSQFRGKKLASYLFSNLLSLAYAQNKFYLRIDTHPKNNRMQHLIKKAGFDYCGLIEINGDPDPDRYAYDLKLGGR